MLREVLWLSLCIYGAGVASGLILGFLLYPRLFVSRGSHTRGSTAPATRPSQPRSRPSAAPVTRQSRQHEVGPFLGRQGIPR